MSRLSLLILVFVLLTQSGCISTSRKGYEIGLIDLTGGISVICNRGFGGQCDIQLAEGMTSDAWMAATTVRVGVPFLLQCSVDMAPYHLRFQLWDESQQYQSIEIREVLLEYKNGECVRKNVDWKRPLKPYTQHSSSGSVSTDIEMFQMTDFMEEIVDRHQDVKITLTGYMIDIQGEPQAFSTPIEFKAKSSFMIAPTWLILSGV